MSSLGEATDRVTSMVLCSIGTVWSDCRVGAEARRSCPAGGGGTGRPAAAQRQPLALASGGTARFYSTLSETQNWDG